MHSNNPIEDITPETLAKTPKRALGFLSGVSRNLEVRRALAAYGYTDAVHQEGWELLGATGGSRPIALAGAPSPTNVTDAITELGGWSVRNFKVTDASLRHAHTAQHAYVFSGELKAQQGGGAVVAVGTFLLRLDGLERDPERAATRDDDRAALERLGARGLTEEERARVQRLVDTVQQGTTVPAETPRAAVAADTARAALYRWFDEWSEIAHVAITRRDLLIRLGLASPRKPVKAGAAQPAQPAQPATPERAGPPGRPSAAPAPN